MIPALHGISNFEILIFTIFSNSPLITTHSLLKSSLRKKNKSLTLPIPRVVLSLYIPLYKFDILAILSAIPAILRRSIEQFSEDSLILNGSWPT